MPVAGLQPFVKLGLKTLDSNFFLCYNTTNYFRR